VRLLSLVLSNDDFHSSSRGLVSIQDSLSRRINKNFTPTRLRTGLRVEVRGILPYTHGDLPGCLLMIFPDRNEARSTSSFAAKTAGA
jgi:hypothetical protein